MKSIIRQVVLFTFLCVVGTTFTINAKKIRKPEPNGVDISAPTGYVNGHGYVDLALPSGTKWATCNVGASQPEEFGNYYAWGEVKPKKRYDKDNALTWGKDLTPISGKKQYDAATNNWGAGWRIPSPSMFEELGEYCDNELTYYKGVFGCKFTSKKNRKSIFMPCGGWYTAANLYNSGESGYYWASWEFGNDKGNGFYINSGNVHTDGFNRSYGISIRPVIAD